MTRSDSGNQFYAIKRFFDQNCGTDYFFVDESSAGVLAFTISDDAAGTNDLVTGAWDTTNLYWTLSFDESTLAAESDSTDGEEAAVEIAFLLGQAMAGLGEIVVDPRGSSSDRNVDIIAVA